MKLKTNFNYDGEEYSFLLDTENADRNYDDEEYMYWIRYVSGQDSDYDQPFFEINLWKDSRGYIYDGKVYLYESVDDYDPAWECDIKLEISTL